MGPLVFWGPVLSLAPGGLLRGDAGAALVSSEHSVGVGPAISVMVTHTGQSQRALGLVKPSSAIKPLLTPTQHSQGGLFLQGKYPS